MTSEGGKVLELARFRECGVSFCHSRNDSRCAAGMCGMHCGYYCPPKCRLPKVPPGAFRRLWRWLFA